MSISKVPTDLRVAKLHNLFGDNGSFIYPNTYPRLIDGVYVNKTPVMTSPTTGGVILEGEYNYCEFKDELFFLKKSHLISQKRNKGMYVLIKDHICNLFKNKADVYATGTLVNTDLENLSGDDFQYTFPVFNNYTKRILIPLPEEDKRFDGRDTASRAEGRPREDMFPKYYPVTDQEYSDFVAQLEINNRFLTSQGKTPGKDVVKNCDYLLLLGRLGKGSTEVEGGKNELVKKINNFVSNLNADVLAGKISNDVMTNATKLNDRFAISYRVGNPLFTVGNENYQIDIDLSGLTDIELINFDTPSSGERYTLDRFNIFLNYDEHKVSRKYKRDEAEEEQVWLHRLSKRVRLPFYNEYSSRGIYKHKNKHRTIVWRAGKEAHDFVYPQKVLIEIPPHKQLTRKSRVKSTARYRSVYLYGWFDWNIIFVWGADRKTQTKGTGIVDWYKHDTGVNPTTVFTKSEQKILSDISGDERTEFPKDAASAIVAITKDEYSKYYPWTRGGYSDVGEPINLGGLLGQFSQYIKGQEGQFETEFPFIVKTGLTGDRAKLKRLKGFKSIVLDLIQLEDLYENAEQVSSYRYTLDIFTPLSRRHRETTQEEDFYIGEKLLFTSGGMAPYLLFQPACVRLPDGWGPRAGVIATATIPVIGTLLSLTGLALKDNEYAYYNAEDIDKNNQLFFKGIDYGSYQYPYSCFDGGSYFKEHAKQGYKKAYENFQPLTPYKRFYENSANYKELKKHIVENTGAYFETNEVDFRTNPIKELKIGDIFYSKDDFFGQDTELTVMPNDGLLPKSMANDFLNHIPSLKGRDELLDNDVVVYFNPKDKKIYIGKVCVGKDRMDLSAGQTILLDENIKNDSSTINYLDTQYTRITPLTEIISDTGQGFDTLQQLIDALKRNRYFKQQVPNSLKELQDSGRNYLFNLKGTPFFCVYDRLGKVSLVFKNKMKYSESEHIPN